MAVGNGKEGRQGGLARRVDRPRLTMKRRRKGETARDRLRGAALRSRCVELRRSGKTYEEIGAEVGISAQGAWKHVRVALDAINAKTGEDATELRTLELLRLDRYLAGLDAAAAAGDVGAVNAALKVAERRARLLGLDAPAKFCASDETGRGIDLASIIAEARSIIASATPEELAQLASVAGRAQSTTEAP